MSCNLPSIPVLGKEEKYHVFISYSSSDTIWVYQLIHKLEESFPDLKICFHERDFVPGKTVIDNMVTCIQSSQKIMMILSPDFVQSRWCLFEANLSIFQDCLLQKAIVPIVLKPCLVPFYLSHLTYLEADDDQFFDKLLQSLLSSIKQVDPSTLIQPSFLCGKTLLSLPAINGNDESLKPLLFSSVPVPNSSKAVLNDSGTYRNAVEINNYIPFSRSCVRCRVVVTLLFFAFVLCFILYVFVRMVISV